MFKGGAHTELGQPDDAREFFCPYLRFRLIRNVPEISTTFYRYSIIYPILLSATLHNTSRPDPTRRGLTRSDATRPGPTRLHSSPDSSQNEGRITRPCTLSDFNCTITWSNYSITKSFDPAILEIHKVKTTNSHQLLSLHANNTKTHGTKYNLTLEGPTLEHFSCPYLRYQLLGMKLWNFRTFPRSMAFT